MIRASKDIDFVHRRRWPGRPLSLVSSFLLLVISPGLRLVLIHRIAHWLYLKRQDKHNHGWLWRVMLIPIGLLKLSIKLTTKSDICSDCEIEGGIVCSDQGNIIFGARKAGTGTVIGTRVTVGLSHEDMGRPLIGRNVWIGSDCVIYGEINIGDGSTLLPGTVLTKSIPPGVVMQGNPARLLLRNFDNSKLREYKNVDAERYVNAMLEEE